MGSHGVLEQMLPPRFRAKDAGLAHVPSSREGTELAHLFSGPRSSHIREKLRLPDALCGKPTHWVTPIPQKVTSFNRGGEGVGQCPCVTEGENLPQKIHRLASPDRQHPSTV